MLVRNSVCAERGNGHEGGSSGQALERAACSQGGGGRAEEEAEAVAEAAAEAAAEEELLLGCI